MPVFLFSLPSLLFALPVLEIQTDTGNAGYTPSFWTRKRMNSGWSNFLSNEANTPMTTDGSLDWMGGFTRNDPTALDKPCFFFPSTSISFVVIGLRLSFFLSFFLSFSFFTNFKDTLFVALSEIYHTPVCVCVRMYIL
jgi:hypothetical protein